MRGRGIHVDSPKLVMAEKTLLIKPEAAMFRKSNTKRLPHHDISETIKPADLKFERHVPFMECRSSKSRFCKIRASRVIARG
ncbi:hypothetical protein TNCV_4414911 [Trichonephila clavipes]|uniref:Uncharacterized protein n=1 Tax=Trichonephila clavipes TaxID=2585209 RepID=A0A8X6VDZ9_TRICX|nr:hypothetical protein TNCV_4414911 [Trichonephila clavipes]